MPQVITSATERSAATFDRCTSSAIVRTSGAGIDGSTSRSVRSTAGAIDEAGIDDRTATYVTPAGNCDHNTYSPPCAGCSSP